MVEEKQTTKSNSIIITGDLTIDNHIYEGERFSSKKNDARGVKVVKEYGGSFNIYKILHALNNELWDKEEKGLQPWSVYYDFPVKDDKILTSLQNSFIFWKPFDLKNSPKENKSKDHDEPLVWRIGNAMGYGEYNENLPNLKIPEAISLQRETIPVPRILVIDDGGYTFRNKENSERWKLSNDIDYIVLKMSSPIATGDLWNKLIEKYSEKLIVVVSADELRKENYKISKDLSWEKTIEDLRELLFTVDELKDLAKCRHLIINFSMDGAIWIENKNNSVKAGFIYDASLAEGEWEEKYSQKVFGFNTCLVSAIVDCLMKNLSIEKKESLDLEDGIESGLAAMRNLLQFGHGFLAPPSELGFPTKRIAESIKTGSPDFSRTSIPWSPDEHQNKKGEWMIVEMLHFSDKIGKHIPIHSLAAQLIYHGKIAIKNIPHASFGKFITVDRLEIEALRQIRRFIIDYKNDKSKNSPISFGVFGPPGAGKSFGVRQITKNVFGEEAWLEFNLSQFNNTNELYGAFHIIRDLVLKGITPVVFMDEFDSQEYRWLQYLLEPMESGKFHEGQVTHYLGRCIFIFAGATSYTYRDFGEFKKNSDQEKKFKLVKGPDFKSRLDSYYNVIGPNQRIEKDDNVDITYKIRRALIILNNLKSPTPENNKQLVNALLSIKEYKNGTRSMNKLLRLLMSKDKKSLSCSNLPSKAQLFVYVDPDAFLKLCEEKINPIEKVDVEILAEKIHERWREHCRTTGSEMKEQFDKLFKELSPEIKEDNIAAAIRMQDNLFYAGLKILKADTFRPDEEHERIIKQQLEYQIDLLAENEHKGWMKQREKNGWSHGLIRIDKEKKHPDMVPYSQLSDVAKNKDKNSIRNMPDQLKSCGYSIVWIE